MSSRRAPSVVEVAALVGLIVVFAIGVAAINRAMLDLTVPPPTAPVSSEPTAQIVPPTSADLGLFFTVLPDSAVQCPRDLGPTDRMPSRTESPCLPDGFDQALIVPATNDAGQTVFTVGVFRAEGKVQVQIPYVLGRDATMAVYATADGGPLAAGTYELEMKVGNADTLDLGIAARLCSTALSDTFATVFRAPVSLPVSLPFSLTLPVAQSPFGPQDVVSQRGDAAWLRANGFDPDAMLVISVEPSFAAISGSTPPPACSGLLTTP